ncbi:MAG: flagellar protein [Eubacterium sp.]|nr:flagellar protein [Eubacterium sp.]
MEILPCTSCGRLFNYIRGERICPNCQKMLEDKFVEVKKYIRENPNADIKTVAEEMDVTVRQIHRWIREERLVFSDDSPIGIPCESCGVSIKTGRFCDKCRSNLAAGLKDAAGVNVPKTMAERPKRKTDNRMRFLDN